MIQEANVLKAIKGSGVSKITIIDDAFDPPEIDTNNAGNLLGFLEGDDFGPIGQELGLAEKRAGAMTAIENSEYDADELVEMVSAIYDRFVTTADEKFNPNGIFSTQVPNINYLRPLLTLLDKANPKLEIQRIGSNPELLAGVNKDTHLIFIDFYLDRGVVDDSDAKAKGAAKKISLERVKELLRSQGDNAASVILMSWQDVESEADKFRENIVEGKKSLVFASRF
jgi:hypothetical protein